MGLGRQNRDFFGTFLALWSHLGPSPKFGTLSERLDCSKAHHLPSRASTFWVGTAAHNSLANCNIFKKMMICIEKSGWDRRKEEGVARERGERGGEKAGNSPKLK